MKRIALLAAAALALSGCGLRPLYGGGPDGPVRSTLSAVEVAPIQSKSAARAGPAPTSMAPATSADVCRKTARRRNLAPLFVRDVGQPRNPKDQHILKDRDILNCASGAPHIPSIGERSARRVWTCSQK